MFDIIVAVSLNNNNLGIGIDNNMAWRCLEELKLFKAKTTNSIVIMGSNTMENLPCLKNRTFFLLSRTKTGLDCIDNFRTMPEAIFPTLDDALDEASKYPNMRVFVAGGEMIYKLAMSKKKYLDQLDKIHISFMKDAYTCNKFFPFIFLNTHGIIASREEHPEFTHIVFTRGKSEEYKYLNLLRNVVENGDDREGRNGVTRSLFAPTTPLEFNLDDGNNYPLLTTKRMYFKGIVEELLFFIRGDTDTKLLEQKGVNIWRGNTNRDFLDNNNMSHRQEGVMGQMYGYQWRYFNQEYNESTAGPKQYQAVHDQLQNLVDTIRTDPHSRRLLLTTYNPAQAKQGVLYPCHSIVNQFYVRNGIFLDMVVYNRSSDLFLGLPFNIGSSALFLIFISRLTGYRAGRMVVHLGDAHIYQPHYDAVMEQLSRYCYKFPQLKIQKNIKTIRDIEALEYGDFVLENYKYYPTIKAAMVA